MKKYVWCVLLIMILLMPAAMASETDPAIARLHVTFECGCDEWRSGTMVSKVGMITPSGSLYCTEHGKKYARIIFYFGWQGNDQADYIYDGDFSFEAYETFPKGYVNTNDIAYIKFPYSIGDRTGWYSCKAASDKELKNAKVTIRDVTQEGVAYDFQDKAGIKNAKIIQWSRNSKDKYSTYGPPVFLEQGDGERILVAIHTSHDNKRDFCRRITERVYGDMTKAGIFTDDPGMPPDAKEPTAVENQEITAQAEAGKTVDQIPSEPEIIFSSYNTDAVKNGASSNPSFTLGEQDVLVVSLTTYHWNKGKGAKPGTISIYSADNMLIGSWDAEGQSGSGKKNVNWVAYPNIMLEAGKSYYIVDSAPKSWSWNNKSGGVGFAEIRGIKQAAATESAEQTASPTENAWICPACGQEGNTGNYCINCGITKPAADWTCTSCGATGNTGRFCTNCGEARPDGEKQPGGAEPSETKEAGAIQWKAAFTKVLQEHEEGIRAYENHKIEYTDESGDHTLSAYSVGFADLTGDGQNEMLFLELSETSGNLLAFTAEGDQARNILYEFAVTQIDDDELQGTYFYLIGNQLVIEYWDYGRLGFSQITFNEAGEIAEKRIWYSIGDNSGESDWEYYRNDESITWEEMLADREQLRQQMTQSIGAIPWQEGEGYGLTHTYESATKYLSGQ